MIAPPARLATTAAATQEASSRFVREAHTLVRDLLVPRAARYWLDFLVTIAVAYTALAVVSTAAPWSIPLMAAMVVASLAAYRAVVFTHEIAHRTASFRAFAAVWNALCGVPLLVPSFLYGNHNGHHASDHYGTWADPEYLIRGSRSPIRRASFLLLAFVYPLLPIVRFAVLTPLACVSRRIDRVVWTWGSSLYVMNETYRRAYDRSAHAPSRWVQEAACAAWAWALVVLAAEGTLTPILLGRLYGVAAGWMLLNQLRTLAAHRYGNDSGAAISYLDQVLDTHTFPQGLVLPHLWAPLGLRYHALHHLMPALPYHAMGAAHRRLLGALPPGSPYHQTIRPGLWSALTTPPMPSSSD